MKHISEVAQIKNSTSGCSVLKIEKSGRGDIDRRRLYLAQSTRQKNERQKPRLNLGGRRVIKKKGRDKRRIKEQVGTVTHLGQGRASTSEGGANRKENVAR